MKSLKAITEVSTLVVALAIVGGWSYVTRYFAIFGVNAYEIDISVPLAALVSLHVLYRASGLIVTVLGLASALLLFRQKSRRATASLRQYLGVALFVAAFGMMSVVGLRYGEANAMADLFEESSRLPSVGFSTDLQGDFPRCVTDGAVECRLLVHWKQSYYFFEPLRASVIGPTSFNVELYVLPDNQVKFVHLVRGVN